MVKLAILNLNCLKKFNYRDGEKLRGYMGNLFQNNLLFHNHIDRFTFNYESAKISYKVIDGILSVVGTEEGADMLLKNYSSINEIEISGEHYEVKPEIIVSEFELNISDEIYSYNFLTPWFALNQENYKRYRSGDLDLNKQLRNNILEFFKMNGVWADREIKVSGEFKEFVVTQKDTKILAFIGQFQTNVKLPDYIGLGKRKSIGYGTIKMIDRR